MKRLDLMNGFMRRYILILALVMVGMMLPMCVWGDPWTKKGNTWYILDSQYNMGNGSLSSNVYVPAATSGYLYFYMDDVTASWPTINYSENTNNSNSQTFGSNGINKNCKGAFNANCYCKYLDDDKETPYSKAINVTANCTTANYNGARATVFSANVRFKLSILVPEHTFAKSSQLSEVDFGVVEMNSVKSMDIDFTSLFTSFMTKSGFTLECSTTSPSETTAFWLDESHTNNTSLSICGANSAYAETNSTPLTGTTNLIKKSDGKFYLRLYFRPTTSSGTFKGKFVLKAGSTTVVTIPVKGTGGKISPTVTWTNLTTLNPGQTINNPATVSPNSVTISSYSSADNTKIAVSGNQLIAMSATEPNKVTISATTTASGDYKAITSTQEFMVTNKQIQTITWNQKFTNLKVGDADITLNATASSGGPITYRVENNNTSIVTIVTSGNQKKLHIVGTGDIKIYAKQAGGTISGKNYLEIETYKQVKVRAVGAACEECAIESSQAWSTSLNDEESNDYEVKSVDGVQAPTGNILKFHYSAGAPAPFFNLSVKVDGNVVGTYSSSGETKDNKEETITLNGSNAREDIQTVSFSWESTSRWGGLSLSTVSILDVCLSQASYFRSPNNSAYIKSKNFNTVDKGDESTAQLKVAQFSALSSSIEAKIISTTDHPNGSSFKLIENGAEVDETTIDIGCSDFGDALVNVKFKPLELGNLSAQLRLIGYKGSVAETLYVDLSGICTETPTLKWNNTSFSNVPVFDTDGKFYKMILQASTTSSATPSFELLNTADGVASLDGCTLTIYKAGVDITVKAKVAVSGFYNNREIVETFKAVTVTPTLTWKSTAMGTSYKVGDEISVSTLLTQAYNENDAAAKLGNITVSAENASNQEMLQMVTTGNINTAKVKVIKGGAISKLTASTPAVTNYFNASGSAEKSSNCGSFAKNSQSITWTPDASVSVGTTLPVATATSGQTVTFATTNSTIASINATTEKVDCTAPGIVMITASCGENDSYTAAPNVPKVVVVNPNSFNYSIDESITPQSFIISNNICSGNITVETGDNSKFELCSTQNGTYGSSVTVSSTPATIWVKLKSTNEAYEGSETIDIKTATCGTYSMTASANVTRRVGTIIAPIPTGDNPDTLYFESNDHSEHLIVGINNNDVYGMFNSAIDAEMTDYIELSVDDDVAQYVEIIDGKKLKVKTGIKASIAFPVVASIPSTNKRYAAEQATFYVRIRVNKSSNQNNRTWIKDGSTWYIFKKEPQISTWATKNNWTFYVYVPNVACPGTFAIKGDGVCDFTSTLSCDGTSLKRLTGGDGKSDDFSSTIQSISVPSKSNSAVLTTNTNCYAGEAWICQKRGNLQNKYAQIIIPVPLHYNAKSNITRSVETEVGEVSYVDIPLNEMFTSFRTDQGLNFVVGSNPNNVFSIDKTALVAGNHVFSPYTPLSDANNGFVMNGYGNYLLRIYFTPLAAVDYEGVFYLKDNNNTKFTITINGKGKVSESEPQYIVWNQDLSHLKVGDAPVTLAATSSSGLPVTFERVSGNVSVSGTTMTITGADIAKVKAKCSGGSNNGVSYAEAEQEREFVIYPASGPSALENCTEIIDVSAWNNSTINAEYNVAPARGVWTNPDKVNSAIEVTEDYTVKGVNVTLTLANCETSTTKIYVNGTAESNVVATFTQGVVNHYIDLSSKNVGKGSKFYCSFSGTNTSQTIFTAMSYEITDFTLQYNSKWTAPTSSTTVDFGSQRVGQPGKTKKVSAASFSKLTGNVSATITGDDADCFVIVGENPFSPYCEAGAAAFDVRFVPVRTTSSNSANGSTLKANLVVTGPAGQTAPAVILTGTATKRDLKIDWVYAGGAAKAIDAVGTEAKTSLSPTDAQNAFAYDKLRGDVAKTSLKVDYSPVNGTVELLDNSKSNIVDVTTDSETDKLTKIQATGYGSGNVNVVASVNTGNDLFNTVTAAGDVGNLAVTVRKVDADISLSVGSPFSLDDLHYGDKVEITGVKTTYDGVTLKKVDGTTPLHAVSDLTLTANNCSIPTGSTQKYLCLTTVSSSNKEVYVTAAVSGNAIVNAISNKKISFTVGMTGQKVLKQGSISDKRTRTDGLSEDILLRDYFLAYDTRHSSSTISGCSGIPTFLTIDENGYVKSVDLNASDFAFAETFGSSDCSGTYNLADLVTTSAGVPAIRTYSTAWGSISVKVSSGKCGNAYYNATTEESTSLSYSVKRHSPNIEFIVGGTAASSVANKGSEVTVDVTYGETVTLAAHSYNSKSSGEVFYDSNNDPDKSFTFSNSDQNVGTIISNSFTALNVGTTDITITQTPNCKITTYSNLAGTSTGVSADDTPNPNKWYKIEVKPATRTIVWPNKTNYTNLTSASPDFALDAFTKDKNDNPIDPGAAGTVTYSIESADNITGTSPALPCVQLSSDNKTLIINGSGTATIKVSFAKSNYEKKEDTWTINITDEAPALSVTPSPGISITSTDKNVDMLQYFSITNYAEETIVKSVSNTKTNVLEITGNQTLKAFKEDASVQVPCTVEVTSRYLLNGTHPKVTGSIVFDITKGALVFYVAGGGKWMDASKWSREDIVSEKIQTVDNVTTVDLSAYNVRVIQNCFIGKDPTPDEEEGDETEWLTHRVDAACNNLTIDGTDAKVVIGEASTLRVAGDLTNTDASKLVLTANNWGQASVVFGNTSNYPNATVEMFLPAGNGSNTTPVWHYRGIAVHCFDPITSVPTIDDKGNPAGNVNPWGKVQIYKWDETQNFELTHGCWVDGKRGSSLSATDTLEPWVGYAFANMTKDPVWLSYKGRLIKANQSMTLDYHDNKYNDNGTQKSFANVGMNLITNSYTAPLLISQMGFSNSGYVKTDGSLEAGVVLYNSGSYKQWETAHSGGGGNAGAVRGSAGQHSTVPKNTTEAVGITMVPCGQAFFVQAKQTRATFTLTYGNDYFANSPNTRMYLPGQNEEPEFNVLKIDVVAKSDSTADQLILLESDSCSRQYDNGYDGIKRFGDSGLPQLYAYNKFGITAVNADSTFNKQYVGFAAGSDDETYTISFETDRLFGYHSLYLVDRKLNETVDILAGETYSFKGYTVGENTRFQINGMTIEEYENQEKGENDEVADLCDLRVVGNTLFVEGFTAEHYKAANIEIYDMTGNMVWSTALTDSRVYDLPALPQGVYTIRLGDCHVKYGVR